MGMVSPRKNTLFGAEISSLTGDCKRKAIKSNTLVPRCLKALRVLATKPALAMYVRAQPNLLRMTLC